MSSAAATADPAGSDGTVPVAHEDKAAFGFLIVAGKLNIPTLLGSVPWLTWSRLRPIHVNGMLFGWLLAADMGLCFYMIPRLCGVKLWSEKLGMATLYLWVCIILGAVVTLAMGMTQGMEYAELAFGLDVLVVVAWIMFGLNIIMTVATRKYEQMYVSIWYTTGAILWTAVVYGRRVVREGARGPVGRRQALSGREAPARRRLHRRRREPGHGRRRDQRCPRPFGSGRGRHPGIGDRPGPRGGRRDDPRR
jgi:hypothetical protein